MFSLLFKNRRLNLPIDIQRELFDEPCTIVNINLRQQFLSTSCNKLLETACTPQILQARTWFEIYQVTSYGEPGRFPIQYL